MGLNKMRKICKKCKKELEIVFPLTKYCTECSLEVWRLNQKKNNMKQQ